MSTVMRPRGPLPARVYWTRRLLLVAVVVVVLALVWTWLPGGGGSSAASADPGAHSTEPSTPTTTQTHTTPTAPTGTKSPTRHPRSTPPTTTAPPTRPPKTHPTTPLSAPTGPCDPAKVALTIDVKPAVEGAGTRIGLAMSTMDGSTCSLGVTPSRLEIRITSGEVPIWQSTSCPDGLAAKNVVVRPQPAVVYTLVWNGRISPGGCATGVRVAKPGGYWVEAALIGGEPHKAYFPVIPATPPTAG